MFDWSIQDYGPLESLGFWCENHLLDTKFIIDYYDIGRDVRDRTSKTDTSLLKTWHQVIRNECPCRACWLVGRFLCLGVLELVRYDDVFSTIREE